MHNTEERLSLVLSQQLTREDPAMKGAPSSFAFSTIHSASCQLYELRHTDHRQQGSARTCTQALMSGKCGWRGGNVQVFVVEDGNGSAAGGEDAENLLHEVLPREKVLPFLVPPEAWSEVAGGAGWGRGRWRTGNRHAPRS